MNKLVILSLSFLLWHVSALSQCPFNPNWTISNETCTDYNDGQICCSPSGGTPPYDCTISPLAGIEQGSCFVALPPSNSPYTVTITDANGCSVSGEFSIIENNYPELVITTSATAACNGIGSACVSVSGGSGSVNIDWFSNSSFTNYIGSGSCINSGPGTYWYRVEDATPNVPFTECVNTGFVLIENALPAITSQIIPNNSCECPGGTGQIDITLTGGTGSYDLSWTGPNGFTSNQEDISSLCEGEYVLTIMNGSCSISQTFIVGGTLFQVVSNGICQAPMQNDCDCHTLTGNTAWNPSTFGMVDINVDATVIVPSGVTLTIENLNLFITPHHVIRVLPGGTLIAVNSSFDVTCGATWRGFEAVGVGFSSLIGQRGYLELESCDVLHAECGIRNYRAALNGNCSLLTQPFSKVSNTSGGRVNCFGGTVFQDNIKDLSLFDFYANGTDPNNFGARFDECVFRSTIDGFPSPSEWSLENAKTRIHLQRMVDVSFTDCALLMENASYSNSVRTIGVLAEWTDFFWNGSPAGDPNLYTSRITGFRVGMWISGSSVSADEVGNIHLTHVIGNTYFENFRSIDVKNSRNLFVIDNYFDDMQPGFVNSSISGVDVGGRVSASIYYVVSTGFPAMNYRFAGNVITTNLFDTAPLIGVYVYNTGARNNFVYGNSFTNCATACLFHDKNRGDDAITSEGTHYECNVFTDCGRDVRISIPNPNLSGLANQGVAPVQGNFAQSIANQSAGNQYVNSASASQWDDIWVNYNNPPGHTYRYETGELIGGSSPTEVDPDITLENVLLFIPPGASHSCDWDYYHDIPMNPISVIQDAQNNFANLLEQYQYLVDGGNTDGLKFQVENSTFSQALNLYQDLLNVSPSLSEEVMLAAIQKEYELPKPLLTTILSMNPSAAKSAAIKAALDGRADPLDEYQMNQIMLGLQAQSVKENLEAEMALSYCQLQKTKDEWARGLEIDMHPLNNLLEIYNEDEWSSDRLIEAEILMRHGRCDEGIQLLESYDVLFELKPEQKIELNNYISYAELSCDILHRTEASLTENEFTFLMSIVDTDELGLGLDAANLLNAFGGTNIEIHPLELEMSEGLKSMRVVQKEIQANSIIYPNPVGSFFILKSDALQASSADILSCDGRLIRSITLQKNSFENVVETDDLSSGLYILMMRDAEGNTVEKLMFNK